MVYKGKKIIAVNWKANLNKAGVEELLDKYLSLIPPSDKYKIVIFPSAVHLSLVQERIANYPHFSLGAQNMYWEMSGAFTGEICPKQLVDTGVEYILLGHSERREYFYETYERVNKKLISAVENKLKPVLCIGESIADKKADVTEMVIADQLESAFEGLKYEDLKDMVIVYEPIWAIGTGKSVPINKLEGIIEVIKTKVQDHFERDDSSDIAVLSGGSIRPGNATEYGSCQKVDGFLIGTSSLNGDHFHKIINCACQQD